jgi:hypothetical protein
MTAHLYRWMTYTPIIIELIPPTRTVRLKAWRINRKAQRITNSKAFRGNIPRKSALGHAFSHLTNLNAHGKNAQGIYQFADLRMSKTPTGRKLQAWLTAYTLADNAKGHGDQ